MKRPLALVALTFFLVGCGEQEENYGNLRPLAHALAAYRFGNHQEFLVAKGEAQAALKNAIKPGDDLCFATMLDFERYGAVAVIAKLDKPDLFQASEETRFVYALNLISMGVGAPEPGSFMSQAPIARQNQFTESCAGKAGSAEAVRVAAGPAAGAEREDRATVMKGWRDQMKTANYYLFYNAKMNAAARNLQSMGYNVGWPVQTDLVE